jgi:Na+-transporting NADH:ubiquinone oxidoreductase subunit NqrF
MQIIIRGKASGKEVKKLSVSMQDQNKNLLDFLRENQVAVASSCDGDNVCKLCKTDKNILVCNFTVIDYYNNIGNTITFDYL